MSILDKAQIGNNVQINLELSKDRLTKEVIDVVNISSKATISDFRITDGKSIGVILKLANGKEQWFFENEIEILDENGNPIKKDIERNGDSELLFRISEGLEYENQEQIGKLLNPINFATWLVVSLKDIF